LNQPDVVDALKGLALLPCDAAGPVFAEPWQAQAFAMTVALHQQGLFTWNEWAAALSAEIKAHGGTDDGSRYYEFWLHTLEDLLVAKGAAKHSDINTLAESWARAAEATPHGKPIELANDPQG
jgi:nitrile hydratase accessory protein